MEIFLDCLPCVLRQVLEASRMATDKPEIQAIIMEKSVMILADYKSYKCSPDIVRDMHQSALLVYPIHIKRLKNEILSPQRKLNHFSSIIWRKNKPMYWASKIAATGNIVDSAIYSDINIESSIEIELAKELICDISALEEILTTAKSILIIGDNAGDLNVFNNANCYQ